MKSAPASPVAPSVSPAIEAPTRSDERVAPPPPAIVPAAPERLVASRGDAPPGIARTATVSLPVLHCSFLC
jgi:hypothetical protein